MQALFIFLISTKCETWDSISTSIYEMTKIIEETEQKYSRKYYSGLSILKVVESPSSDVSIAIQTI